MKDILRQHRGNVVLEPPKLKKPPNSVLAIVGREFTGTINKQHFLTNNLYSRMKLFARNVGHLSAVYCMLFDRRGR